MCHDKNFPAEYFFCILEFPSYRGPIVKWYYAPMAWAKRRSDSG